ncbi:hypothetical protein [Minwuia sp.]|uniref:hypothetical protein n=1 Tax=Minwuia sp. TaxID=2493630 RepID=UPI003A8DA029
MQIRAAFLLTIACLGLLAVACSARSAGEDDKRWVQPEAAYPERLSIHARDTIHRYRNEPFPLALVIAPDGGYATYWRCRDENCRFDDEVYVERALKVCAERAHIGDCLVHSIRDKTIWPVPQQFETEVRSRLVVPWLHENRGPAEAKGAVVHIPGFAGHRYPSTLDHPITPYHLLHLNRRGYDTFRLNIAHYDYSRTDRRELGDMLVNTVRRLRDEGYRRVFLNGQSRGAWEILAATPRGLGIDGAMLFAPAAHGRAEGWSGKPNPRFEKSEEDFDRLVQGAADLPYFFAFFQGDPYDPGGRAETLGTRLRERIGTTVAVLDQPAELAGHGAGGRVAFHRIYGVCLEDFLAGAPVRFEDCATPFSLSDNRAAATEAHLIDLGGTRVEGVALKRLMRGRALYPIVGPPGWGGFHARPDGELLQWFPGDYLTGNRIEAEWRIEDDEFCIIDSPRMSRNRYCYRVYDMPDGSVGLVAPDGLALVAGTKAASEESELGFEPGDWRGDPVD